MLSTLGLQRKNLLTVPKFGTDVYAISDIHINSIYVEDLRGFQIYEEHCIEDVQPLNITPETIALFDGWQHIVSGFITLRVGDLFLRHSPRRAVVQVWHHGGIVKNVKYIHELQNIVSVLTGEYLQLKTPEQESK